MGQTEAVKDTLTKRLLEQQHSVESEEDFLSDNAQCIVLSEEMRDAVDKAERSLVAGECLTEDGFMERFAKWLELRMFKKQKFFDERSEQARAVVLHPNLTRYDTEAPDSCLRARKYVLYGTRSRRNGISL